MIKYYLKITLRNLARQKALAAINIFGLSIGLACFCLFLLHTVNEFSYDRFHANASRIYRVYEWWDFGDRKGSEPSSSTPLGLTMKQDFPDVEDFVRFKSNGEQLVRVGKNYYHLNLLLADPQVFNVFTFPVIAGNPSTALESDKSIVLTRRKAMQLFGSANIVGNVVEIRTGDHFEPYEVSAVTENIPDNSSISFDMLASINNVLNTADGRESLKNWHMTLGMSVYVLLNKNSTLMNDWARLASFYRKYLGDDQSAKIQTASYALQPLTDVHTNVKIDPWGAVNSRNI